MIVTAVPLITVSSGRALCTTFCTFRWLREEHMVRKGHGSRHTRTHRVVWSHMWNHLKIAGKHGTYMSQFLKEIPPSRSSINMSAVFAEDIGLLGP